MNALKDLPEVSSFGINLSVEQRAAMELSLAAVMKNYRFKRGIFWGKIKAHQRDYYIAQGFEGDLLTTKKTFVSQSLTKWAQLPEVNDQQRARAKTLHGMFTGDLSYEYIFKEEVQPWEPNKPKKVNEDGEEEDPSEDELIESPEDELDPEAAIAADPLGGRYLPVVARKKRVRRYPLTEEVRLACVVERIDWATSVVPRGAFLIDQENRVYANPRFEGLPAGDAGNLSFYLHLRTPAVVPKQPLLAQHAANLIMDFLDRLSDDVPKGAWSVVAGGRGENVTLRSLVWPGYFAFHIPGQNKFGAIYVGTGQENTDFGFMI